jgi:hypothetical protein
MIFISHSTANDSFVNRLSDELQIRGIQTWVDHRDMPAGSRWVAELEAALMQSDVMLLVLSAASTSSSYVESEWHTFFNMGRKIIPLMLDDCDVPLFLRTFHQVDFRRQDAFRENIDALLQVLPESLDKTSRSNSLTGILKTPETSASIKSMMLNQHDMMCLAEELIDNKALTLCAGTIQFILPVDEIILQYPLVNEMLIGRSHRSVQFRPDVDLNGYKYSHMVSRRHLSLFREGSSLYIQDNKSSNGSFINDIALSPLEYYPIESHTLIYLSHHFPILIRYQF